MPDIRLKNREELADVKAEWAVPCPGKLKGAQKHPRKTKQSLPEKLKSSIRARDLSTRPPYQADIPHLI